MNDAAVVGRVLREYHARGIDPTALRRVAGSVHAASVTYLVRPDVAQVWLVRARREDTPVPVHLIASGVGTMLDWLLTRAGVLDCLAERGYPAPRVVRTRAGDPVGMDGIWLTLATTFVDGPLIRPSLAQLRMLGAALGRLHAVDAAGLSGRAAWYPEEAIPATLARLDAVEPLVPDGWRPIYAQLRRTAVSVRQSLSRLPRGVVHGDAWPGNAVQSGPDTVTLIDWETSGLGLPVLDLGNCLIESLLDSEPATDGPAAWLVEPDESRVAAVARGYASQRELGDAEQALLPEAVRFGSCYVGAIHLYQALAEGVSGTSMDAWMERLRNRLAVSEDVARLAAPHLAGGAETVR